MIWLQLQRHAAAAGTPGATNLNSGPMAKLCAVSFSGRRASIRSRFGLREMKALFPKAVPITGGNFRTCAATLMHVDWTVNGRGKYLLEFYVKALVHLIEDANKASPKIFTAHRHVAFQRRYPNALETLAAFADTPPCLTRFLAALYMQSLSRCLDCV
jgi:hypothetical protein